nr:DEAD/DEAH box helicase [bacterium]
MDFDAKQIIKDVTATQEDDDFQNYVAQAHSRSILRGLDAPASEWPSYSRDVDETLHYTAHYLLEQGLRLKESKLYNDKADDYIREGAEILEFLYATASINHHDRTEELFNAALGYYIAGYYARAYVLMKDLGPELKLPQHLELLKRLFLKNLGELRQLISEFLLDSKVSDKVISESLRSGSLSQDEAISHILQASLNRAFSYFIEYPKSGHRPLYEKACEILEQGIKLAKKTHFVDWWWLLYCSMHLFSEYDANSLWCQLAPMEDDDHNGELVRPYIRNSFRRNVPVIELWRSQTKALPIINESERRSYCLRMPTSAGKTRIAELAILRFLLDHADEPEAKCAYIAPFRALAVEIEKTLQESFGPLGIRVSEIYGGFELSPLERLLIDKTKILVATPEKFDAFIRYVPELAGTIKLIIMDEGHIISPTERGLRYEFFVHRLVRRYLATDTRIFFLSAVLPNVQEFAEWITGREDGIIESNWRPSRLMLGELQWNGRTVRIEYTHVLREQLGHECFVPNFIRQLRGEALRGTRRRNPFPNDMKEALAIAAIDFAQRGLTLVFVPQQRSAEPFGKQVLNAIKIRQVIARRDDSDYSLPISQNKAELLNECISVARETMGDDSKMIDFLKAGFVVHHGGLPYVLRTKLEELVRSEGVRLVIATTTLAQGVNFPIQTILVRNLEHGPYHPVDPMTFWNICGRAGRGGKENEGQILFAVDLTKEYWQRKHDKEL